MFGLSATSSSGSGNLQLNLYQFKLQQAKREADKAQDQVRSLEAESDQARLIASRTREHESDVQNQDPARNVTRNAQGQVTGLLLNAQA